MSRGVFRHLYGPVPSRRLGRSLGVDLVPFKVCSYDCVYCQLGRTTNKTIERKEYVSVHEILEELKEKLAVEPFPDYLGLAGSGEPTLHSRLGELIAAIKGITNIPVAVLTNGSLLWMPEVRDALMEADLVLPSLDAGDERLFQFINRPHRDISFEAMVDGIAEFTSRFSGEVWLEVFLLKGRSALPFETQKIADLARRIAPSRVQLNTIHRPPAEDFVQPVSNSFLLGIKDLFSGRVEIISESEQAGTSDRLPSDVQEEELLALIGRRPCSAGDVASGLGIHINEALKQLEQLTAAGKADIVVTAGQPFYTATSERASPRAGEMDRYRGSCQSDFWQNVFRAEIDYLSKQLAGARTVLSVGCGPALIEKGLSEIGFVVTGLDVSKEALDQAPDEVRTVVAPAEKIPLDNASFDAVIFVTSLQFVEDYQRALQEAARVLSAAGKIIVMLLNPESEFFKTRFTDPGSYVSKIRHVDLKAIEQVMSRDYVIQTEYLLGVKGKTVFQSSEKSEAVLYVIRGTKRTPARELNP